jgi:2-iminobutanoate/2-iminopropanoate deaminase
MSKQCMNVENAPPAVGPYSHAVVANGFVFASGQCPFAPDGSGPMRGTIEEETRVAMDNVKSVLEGVGTDLAHVVKTVAYLSDMANFQRFNAVYKEYFPVDPPARTCIQAARLPLDVQVEIDVIAVLPGN